MEKRIALRFDIDSLACVKNGLPGLLRLADRYSFPMTFFVTMGRPIMRRLALARFFAGNRSSGGLSPVERLGVKGAFETFLFNRTVGVTCAGMLKRLLEKNHELGLHGGKNHAWWQRYVQTAGIEAVRKDLDWGYRAFVKLFGKPAGFAAPGFVWSTSTLECIDEKAFLYASDMDGTRPFHPDSGGKMFSHWQVPVTVSGPSHIPFIEWACMQKHSEQDFLAELELKLGPDAPAVLYGHPCWDGTKGIAYLSTAIEYLLDKGYTFVRMKDLVPAGPDADAPGDASGEAS
jgi:peptidoglycan/xylan/chitin deacetylase (PgdA/CDA1 family)